MKKNTGVLIHGFNLQAQNWKEIAWGKPPDLLGRLPMGALVAMKENAEMIVFGTGGSKKDGKIEAVYTRDYFFEHFLELVDFQEFRACAMGVNLIKVREWLRSIAKVEVQSTNTIQEMVFAGKMFEDAGMEKVVIVTSPTHAPRCYNNALAFYGRPESSICRRNVSMRESDTGWASNDDVVVIEPPHRPDDQLGVLRQKVAKMLLNPDKLLEIKKALDL